MTTVVHAITELGYGGAQEMLVRLCTQDVSQQSVRQVVVSLMDEGIHTTALEEAGITVYCLGMRRGIPSPLALYRLIAILRAEKADILVTWLYAADLLGTIAATAAGVRRLVWNIRCSGMDFEFYSRMTRWTVAALSRLSSIPVAIATNSVAGRKSHELLGYSPRRWYYLPNGIDLQQWHADYGQRAEVRDELGIPREATLVGLFARVDPMKDHATFFLAAELLIRARPDIRFVVVGKGVEALKVPGTIKPNVHLVKQRRDVARLLRGLDVLVLSSAFGEGFPNIVCEAMASTVPCVVTDVGDSADLVGDTGRVVPPRDPVALAAAVDDLLSLPPGALAELGRRARERVCENWSIERAADRYRAVWDELMSDSASRRAN